MSEPAIRRVIHDWVDGIATYDLDAVVAHHAEDVVMFDVPPPFDGVRGLADYRDSWAPFFEWLASGAVFSLDELHVTAGDGVAYAYGLVRCGRPEELAEQPDLRLRVSFGLRRERNRWLIAHEHHSFPLTGAQSQSSGV